MWLVAHKKCWTADRLATRNLEHPASCPLCDQEPETIVHLLGSCVFTRQVWFNKFSKIGLQALAPQVGNISFDDWWETINSRVEGQIRKGLNSVIILCAWSIWTH
jgi:hypothetical protein